jgi:hypothetical protein
MVTFDLATGQDDPELRALVRDTPMRGAVEITFPREPSYFTPATIRGGFTQVIVARDGGRIAGVATRTIQEGYLNGRRRPIGHLADLRFKPEYRRGTAVARGYRFLRELHADGRTELYTSAIIEGNRTALSTIAANRADLPRYTDLGRAMMPALALGSPLPAPEEEVVSGNGALLPEIVARLNENPLQFTPVYAERDFLGGRFPGFRIEDLFVLKRGGRIAGVMGVWDQTPFRQTRVIRYGRWLGLMRPVINAFRRPPLPPPGGLIHNLYAAFVATDDREAYTALLRHVYNEMVRRKRGAFLVTGLHERDPRCDALSTYRRIPFHSRLFMVTFGPPPTLDGRIAYIEPALL